LALPRHPTRTWHALHARAAKLRRVPGDLLCPFVVGRDAELAILAAALDAGSGGTVVIVGEAGIGKSRLAREAADLAGTRGRPVVWGRGADTASPVPYRPLIELVAAALRRLDGAAAPALAAYHPVLARLVPATGVAPALDASPAVLAEGILRLLAEARGLAVLEDLHWADADSLAVVEYLVDNAAATPVVLVATARPEEPVGALMRALARRRAATVLDLSRLDAQQVRRVA
jgi:predicted ATPase